MDSNIGRRSFLAALAVAGTSCAVTPAWAVAPGDLVAGEIAPDQVGDGADFAVSDVSDEEIEALVAQLEEIEGVGDYVIMGPSSIIEDGDDVTTYAGANRFETAADQAKAAYPKGSDNAIIVGGSRKGFDALSASGLAATKGPILYTDPDKLTPVTLDALKALKVKSVLIIGGPVVVGAKVEDELKAAGIEVEKRLAGENYHETQLAVFNYGIENKCWNKDLIILATGSSFADALSASPIAYAKKAPIFITADDNDLSAGQKIAWVKAALDGYGKQVAIIGGKNAVSDTSREFGNSMHEIVNGSGKAEWLYGADRYETSAAVAEWGVKKAGLKWNNVAFTTGQKPWDALAGSVLQGSEKSVLLLADSASAATISTASKHKSDIKHVRFFGGSDAVPGSVRTAVMSLLSGQVRYEQAGIAYSRMLDLEVAQNKGYQNFTHAQIDESANPGNFAYGSAGFYQFALVNGGYSGKVSAAQLNGFIATNGKGGMLEGRGQDFIDAAKAYDTNEVYLLAHAILESGWGKSQLAMGTKVDGVTYYNFFGIGAVDSNPLGGGSSTAGKNGWNSQPNAIVGAAAWIKSNYHANEYGQNTLYKMKWNYPQAAREGTVWKQYATGRTWATGIAAVMDSCFKYCGLNVSTCGLTFVVPQYS